MNLSVAYSLSFPSVEKCLLCLSRIYEMTSSFINSPLLKLYVSLKYLYSLV